jgi:hypothetical protein
MAFPTLSHRRLLLPLTLALMLAGEAAGLAVAAHSTPVAGSPQSVVASPMSRTHAGAASSVRVARAGLDATPVAPHRVRPLPGDRATTRPPIAAAAKALTVRVSTRPAPKVVVSYAGHNHLWIPSLGINRSVASFPCSRAEAPGNYVYRWGCSGGNNVYLMGHAYSVFKPLHDAYVSGRLRNGMKVVYADGNGRIRTYSVIWWKVTEPTTSASWAWAAQSKPSMTLQTCVGSNGNLRLMVRLVATG